jgi:hypothetical protein
MGKRKTFRLDVFAFDLTPPPRGHTAADQRHDRSAVGH